MAHWLLLYELADDYLERRLSFRTEHLRLARASVARGELMLGRAVEDPVDTAMLLFTGEDGSAAETFARADPYVAHGLVVRWRVRRWRTVVGEGAAETAPS